MRGIENDLFLVYGPKLTTCFVRGSKLTSFPCADRKLLIVVSMEVNLVFVVVEIDVISVWGIELDLI